MASKMIKQDFFDRSSVVVAKDLIGKYLCTNYTNEIEFTNKEKKIKRYKITETEAYEGLKDLASHAHRGQTIRNTPMFSHPGTIYVYFTYGMHWMLNIVCGPVGHPAAILIRGLEEISGPARLTKKLNIDKNLNGKMLGKKTGLWIEECDTNPRMHANDTNKKQKIIKTPRIGIRYAGPIWSKKLYRFVLVSGD